MSGLKPMVPLVAILSILFFARKDMGFKYQSHSVDGSTLTLTIDALTERMVITTHTEQFTSLYDKLKQHVEQSNRVKPDPDIVDWSIFKNTTDQE
ncbi:hypothetical protein D3C71_1962080 [compost metagenome]